MDSRFWLTLAGLVLCASGVFSYPLTEELSTNSTSKNETKDAERGAKDTKVATAGAEDARTGNGAAGKIVETVLTIMGKSTDTEFTATFIHDRDSPKIGNCKSEEGLTAEEKEKEPIGACECEAYRSILEKAMLLVLPGMDSSAVDPGIMLGCTLTKERKVQIRLAIRFKSKACLTNCHKICGADGSECKANTEHPMKDFPTKFTKVVEEKLIHWQITELTKLDAGEFMNAIGGCNICAQEPASCPAPCGCPQTYTAQECPANTPPQCCNRAMEAAAAPAQGEVQMQQIVVAPAPQQPMSQAMQNVPAASPCQRGDSSCMMGIPVVQASICAPHCPSSCAPSCDPNCCGGAGKRMLPGR